jgi:hypothetical protein
MTLVNASIASLTRTFPVHADELLYGDKHTGVRSSVDVVQLLDVQDWFALPINVFSRRPLMSKSWRQCFRLVVDQLRSHGDIPFGLAYLPFHAGARFHHRITGKKRLLTDPPELWMGIPSRVHSRGHAQDPNA